MVSAQDVAASWWGHSSEAAGRGRHSGPGFFHDVRGLDRYVIADVAIDLCKRTLDRSALRLFRTHQPNGRPLANKIHYSRNPSLAVGSGRWIGWISCFAGLRVLPRVVTYTLLTTLSCPTRNERMSRSSGMHCAVHGCHNNHRKRKLKREEVCPQHQQMCATCGCGDFRFHRFPQEESLRRQWIAVVNRKNFRPNDSSRVR